MATLVKAIEQNRFKQVKLLFELGDDINQQDDIQGKTPLISTCFIENEAKACRIGKWLMKYGADPGIQDKNGVSSLMYACGLGKEKLVNLFLTHKDFDLNSSDRDGNTALLYSVMQGNKQITEAVIDALNKYSIEGVDKANKRGETALIKASKLGHAGCVDVLLRKGKASPNARDFELKLTAEEWERRVNDLPKLARSNIWTPGKLKSVNMSEGGKDDTRIRPSTETGHSTRTHQSSDYLMQPKSFASQEHERIFNRNKSRINRTLGATFTCKVSKDGKVSKEESSLDVSKTECSKFTPTNRFFSQDGEEVSKIGFQFCQQRREESIDASFRKESSLSKTDTSKKAMTRCGVKQSEKTPKEPISDVETCCTRLLSLKHTAVQSGKYRNKIAPQQTVKALPTPPRSENKVCRVSLAKSSKEGNYSEDESEETYSVPRAEIEVIENGVTSKYGKLQYQSTIPLSKFMEILSEETTSSFRPPCKPLPRSLEISDIEEEEKKKSAASKRARRLWRISKMAVSLLTLNRHPKLFSKKEFSLLHRQNSERFLLNQAKFEQLIADPDNSTASKRSTRKSSRRMSESAIPVSPKDVDFLTNSFSKPRRKYPVTEHNGLSPCRISSPSKRSSGLKTKATMNHMNLPQNANGSFSSRGRTIRQSNFVHPDADTNNGTPALLSSSWTSSSFERQNSLSVVKEEESNICSFPPVLDEE